MQQKPHVYAPSLDDDIGFLIFFCLRLHIINFLILYLNFFIATLNWKDVVLVLGRKLLQHKNQSGESDGSLFLTQLWKQSSCCAAFFLPRSQVFVCLSRLVRWGVCAHGVEQHAPGGGQRPEKALWEETADRSQDERAAPPRMKPQICTFSVQFRHDAVTVSLLEE